MARRIGFFPVMATSFAATVALINPFSARAAERTEAVAAAPVDANATAERVAANLERRYVVPALGARYATMLRANIRAGRYAGITDAGVLGQRITADLQAVAPDGHLRVRPPRDPGARTVPSAPAPKTPAPEVAAGITAARWLEPGVAYLAFSHFSDDPAAIAALAAFVRDHRSARALVIDARAHRGGSFPMMGELCNRLFGKARHLADMDVARAVVEENGVPFPTGPALRPVDGPKGLVRFQHWAVPATDGAAMADVPVFYLTSHGTFSAAEHMAMVLKSTGRATLVGEATGGGNHFGSTEDVGSGLEMFVPIGRTTDPATGADWEGRGVAPDVAVPADAALETALARIRSLRRRG